MEIDPKIGAERTGTGCLLVDFERKRSRGIVLRGSHGSCYSNGGNQRIFRPGGQTGRKTGPTRNRPGLAAGANPSRPLLTIKEVFVTMPISRLMDACADSIASRSLADGGFTGRERGDFRPDATAWAAMGLSAAGRREDLAEAARDRLVSLQAEDGRISMSPEIPQAFWPTSLAILAWSPSPRHREPRERATRFLLATTGLHFENTFKFAWGHDTTIKGWPWIGDTHSWVEPTSLALIALRSQALSGHDRAAEARRMIMDRQIKEGGWNYGNNYILGKYLRPMPESTGLALTALAGKVEEAAVENSVNYLEEVLPRMRTPISLGWSLIGLASWNRTPGNGEDLVNVCLERQAVFGAYDTQQLALMLVTLVALERRQPPFPEGADGERRS